MKKLLLCFTFALSAFGMKAQNCSDLFISQYVEGFGNDKALGIYNPTMNPIYLNNQYRLVRYSNGSSVAAGEANAQASVNLGNDTIASGQEWVIVLDQRDPAGTGQNVPVDLDLQAKANIFLCPVYNTSYAMYFNGNDALSLEKSTDGGNTWNYVDIFAQIGDPGMTSNDGTGGWSAVFPYDNALYESAWTYNHTLIRKASVEQGTTVNPTSWDVADQWDSLTSPAYDSLNHYADSFAHLRQHTCNCPTAGVNEIDKSVSVQLFPNPVISNNQFTILSSEPMQEVDVYNVVGQQVLSKQTNNRFAKQWTVATGNLPQGVYSVRITFPQGKYKVEKLIVQ